MRKIVNYLDKHLTWLVILFMVFNFAYGAWAFTRGNLVYLFNFASGLYSLYVLAESIASNRRR